MVPSLSVLYHVQSSASDIEARAQAIAVEQSVEMPLSAIDDQRVLEEIVGKVDHICDMGGGTFAVRIRLAATTTGFEAGQLLNMLFGNASIYDDITLVDVDFPDGMAAHFGGPNFGMNGLRLRAGALDRALTCSALKPQGLSPIALGDLAGRLALGGVDYIKDDHGIADQQYSRFAHRVEACSSKVREANAATGGSTRYAPSLSGNLDCLRRQLNLARDCGVDTVLVAPMILGFPAFHTLTQVFSDFAFLAHPAMAGAARIAPPLLLGKLFRLLGADATIFPNYGGRFGYSTATCRALAEAALGEWHGLAPCLPVPAGGMVPERVPEMLDFYGPNVMLLIGGALLAARERLTEETAAFIRMVHGYEF